MRLEKAQYNPSLKLAIDISRAVGAPIEEIFILMNRQNAVITFRMAAFLLYFLPYTEPTSLRGGSKTHPSCPGTG